MKPIVIAVVNHKGGCSKTTTAVNLASSLATGNLEMGIRARRVLLIDLDPKGNVATTFGIDKRTLGPTCLLYTSPSPRDRQKTRMPSSA